MKKLSVILGLIVIVILSVWFMNTYKGSDDVNDANSQTNDETDNHNDEADEKALTQTDIVKLIEQKKYQFSKLKIPYDAYREVHMKYFMDTDIDDKFLYTGIMGTLDEAVTMKDFIGKDMEETKEYLESLGLSFESYEKVLEDEDDLMHQVKISDVYKDYSSDEWTTVFVQKKVQSKTHMVYGTAKYIFEKVDDTYKIKVHNETWNPIMIKEYLYEIPKKKFDSMMEKRPFNDKEYIEVIDMKELVGKVSQEENWDALFGE